MDWKLLQERSQRWLQRSIVSLQRRWRPLHQRLQQGLEALQRSLKPLQQGLRERLPQALHAWLPGAEAPPQVRRAVDNWHKGECWVAVAAFGFIATLLLLDVLGRELVGPVLRLLEFEPGATGIFAAQKLSIFALVVGSFAGIGIATATGAHIVPTFASGWVPPAWKGIYDRAVDLITGLFLIGVAYYAFKFVGSSFKTGLRAPVLDWPVWPIQLAIPLGFLSAAGRYLIYALWPSLRPAAPEFQE